MKIAYVHNALVLPSVISFNYFLEIKLGNTTAMWGANFLNPIKFIFTIYVSTFVNVV